LVRAADLELENPAFFRDLIKAVSKVNEEPILTLDPEGIRVLQLDCEHRAMIDLFIPGGFFDVYNVYEARTISLNVKDLLKLVFKRGKMRDTTILMRIEAERILFDIKRGGGSIRKELPLFEPGEEPAPEPKLIYNSRVKIVTETLISAIEDIKTIEEVDHVLITVNDNEISFIGINGDYEAESTYNQYADEILSFTTEGTQKAYYTIDTLLTLVKTLKPISEAITLEYSTDIPIRITPELPIDGHLIYHLAPCLGYTKTEPEPQEDQEVETAAVDPYEELAEIPGADVDAALNDNDIDLDQVSECFGDYDPSSSNCTVYCTDVDACEAEAARVAAIRDQQVAPVEIVPDPHEEQLSPGELYLKYYHEALARNTAEAA